MTRLTALSAARKLDSCGTPIDEVLYKLTVNRQVAHYRQLSHNDDAI